MNTRTVAETREMINLNIAAAMERVRRIVEESKADDVSIIANVRVGFPYRFTHVLGATSAFLSDYPEAREILDENMRDEIAQDHVGMAIRFAEAAGAHADWQNEAHMEPALDAIRMLMRDKDNVHKHGIAILATLENTSQVFIPDMEARAKRRGSDDLEFTQVHGVADEAHATALCDAAARVYGDSGNADEATFERAVNAAVAFIQRIYTPLQ